MKNDTNTLKALESNCKSSFYELSKLSSLSNPDMLFYKF